VPVTPAHALAAVALAPLFRGLPFLALLVGTQVPDLPLFFPWLTPSYEVTHSWRWGAPTNLAYGLALVLACEWMRPAGVALLPELARRRLFSEAIPNWPRSNAALLRVALALLLGAASHALWDELTHEGRLGVEYLPVLGELWAYSLPGYKLLQYGSGVFGTLFLIVWTLRAYQLRPVGADLAQRWRESVRKLALLTMFVIAPVACVLWSYGVALHGEGANRALSVFAYHSITSTCAAELLLCVAARALFNVRSLRAA
jgi:hypothetical protein